MNQRSAFVTAVISTVLPAAASAQEHGGGLSPFSGNVGNALWTLVIFVLVVAILGKFAWGPILELLKAREAFIHDALSSAKRQKEAADASLKEYTEKLQAARLEAESIISQGRADAERVREELKQKARAEAATIVQNAERSSRSVTKRPISP